MRIGITGTRHMRPEHEPIVNRYIEDFIGEADECTTGGCVGVDAHIAKELAAWGLEHDIYEIETISRVIVPADTKLVDWDAVNSADEVIQMPPGTTYRDRNNRILDFTDQLIAFYYQELERPGSGTWMTVNIAKGREIPTELVRLP